MRGRSNVVALTLGMLLVLTVFTQVETEAIKEFNAKVKAYMELQKRAASNVPPLGKKETDPAKIKLHTEALAKAIREARADARAGDVFSPQVSHEFWQIIRSELQGKEGSHSRATVKTGNPTEEENAAGTIVLTVNAPYPDKAPLSSMPPDLLLKLPVLPKGLQYRFLGRHLILFDSMSNLIVDYLLDVVPKA
ncbi:MAG: hypothetical protein L0312_19685 [Acidobacteria bacterium]|nr:hypothetical protein [Acidobacteriota bacterium]